MIYLIIDTNAWIYMCNAYGIEKKRKEESHHIKIFDNLKKLVDEGRVIILSNQIIISEWERNKKHCYEYVSSLKRSKEEIEQKLKQESGSIEEKEELARLKRAEFNLQMQQNSD